MTVLGACLGATERVPAQRNDTMIELTTSDFLCPFGSGAYTGVGSRETPSDILAIMRELGEALVRAGWVLRSGGSRGADTAFEQGADIGKPAGSAPAHKQVFIPWEGFNDSTSPLVGAMPAAREIAARVHPAWRRLAPSAQKLHARNVHQVLGPNLDTPSAFLIAWTEGAKQVGGTRTALVLAEENEVPIFNLAHGPDVEFMREVLRVLCGVRT